MNFFKLTIIGTYLGYFIPYILQNIFQFKIGQEGVDYYAEVHITYLNSIIHTIYMPFTIYGMLLWIPQVFQLDNINSKKLQYVLYLIYMLHYILIDSTIGFYIALYYSIPLYFARLTYDKIKCNYLVNGLAISTFTLLIQEVYGHWYSGDPPSRLEGIPNAMIYAIYYSISHLINI